MRDMKDVYVMRERGMVKCLCDEGDMRKRFM
jgi:hypothetical protein